MALYQLPDGKWTRVPDGITEQEAERVAMRRYPELFTPERSTEDVSPLGAAWSGIRKGAGDWATGISSLYKPQEELRGDIKEGIATADNTRITGLDDVKEAFKKGAGTGLMSLYDLISENVAHSMAYSAPSMAGAYVGGKLGALAAPFTGGASIPIGMGLGALIGGVPLYTGANLERQQEENLKRGTPDKDLDITSAALAAIPQAGLDAAGTAYVLGKTGMQALGGKPMQETISAMRSSGQKELAKAAEKGMARAAAEGLVKGVAVEAPTEWAQQMLERVQAGLPADPFGKESLEAAALGALVGGPLKGATSALDVRAARRNIARVKEQEDAQRMAEELQRTEAQQRAALEASKTPEAMLETINRRETLRQQFNDLTSEIAALKSKDPVTIEQRNDLVEQRKQIGEELAKINEFLRSAPEEKKAAEQAFVQQRQEELAEQGTPEVVADAMDRQVEMIGQMQDIAKQLRELKGVAPSAAVDAQRSELERARQEIGKDLQQVSAFLKQHPKQVLAVAAARAEEGARVGPPAPAAPAPKEATRSPYDAYLEREGVPLESEEDLRLEQQRKVDAAQQELLDRLEGRYPLGTKIAEELEALRRNQLPPHERLIAESAHDRGDPHADYWGMLIERPEAAQAILRGEQAFPGTNAQDTATQERFRNELERRLQKHAKMQEQIAQKNLKDAQRMLNALNKEVLAGTEQGANAQQQYEEALQALQDAQENASAVDAAIQERAEILAARKRRKAETDRAYRERLAQRAALRGQASADLMRATEMLSEETAPEVAEARRKAMSAQRWNAYRQRVANQMAQRGLASEDLLQAMETLANEETLPAAEPPVAPVAPTPSVAPATLTATPSVAPATPSVAPATPSVAPATPTAAPAAPAAPTPSAMRQRRLEENRLATLEDEIATTLGTVEDVETTLDAASSGRADGKLRYIDILSALNFSYSQASVAERVIADGTQTLRENGETRAMGVQDFTPAERVSIQGVDSTTAQWDQMRDQMLEILAGYRSKIVADITEAVELSRKLAGLPPLSTTEMLQVARIDAALRDMERYASNMSMEEMRSRGLVHHDRVRGKNNEYFVVEVDPRPPKKQKIADWSTTLKGTLGFIEDLQDELSHKPGSEAARRAQQAKASVLRAEDLRVKPTPAGAALRAIDAARESPNFTDELVRVFDEAEGILERGSATPRLIELVQEQSQRVLTGQDAGHTPAFLRDLENSVYQHRQQALQGRQGDLFDAQEEVPRAQGPVLQPIETRVFNPGWRRKKKAQFITRRGYALQGLPETMEEAPAAREAEGAQETVAQRENRAANAAMDSRLRTAMQALARPLAALDGFLKTIPKKAAPVQNAVDTLRSRLTNIRSRPDNIADAQQAVQDVRDAIAEATKKKAPAAATRALDGLERALRAAPVYEHLEKQQQAQAEAARKRAEEAVARGAREQSTTARPETQGEALQRTAQSLPGQRSTVQTLREGTHGTTEADIKRAHIVSGTLMDAPPTGDIALSVDKRGAIPKEFAEPRGEKKRAKQEAAEATVAFGDNALSRFALNRAATIEDTGTLREFTYSHKARDTQEVRSAADQAARAEAARKRDVQEKVEERRDTINEDSGRVETKTAKRTFTPAKEKKLLNTIVEYNNLTKPTESQKRTYRNARELLGFADSDGNFTEQPMPREQLAEVKDQLKGLQTARGENARLETSEAGVAPTRRRSNPQNKPETKISQRAHTQRAEAAEIKATSTLDTTLNKRAATATPAQKRAAAGQAIKTFHELGALLDKSRRTTKPSGDARVTEQPTTGITEEQAQEVAQRAGAGIEYVWEPQESADLVRAIESMGEDPDLVQGVTLPDGRIIVVGRNHANALDLETTIAHEDGHARANAYLGDEGYARLAGNHSISDLVSLAAELGHGRDAAQVAARTAGMDPSQRKRAVLSEVLAGMAEARPSEKWSDKLKRFVKEWVGAARQWLRDRGFAQLPNLTDADLYHVLSKALAYEGPSRGGPGGGVDFRTREKPSQFKALAERTIAQPTSFKDWLGKNFSSAAVRTAAVDRHDPMMRLIRGAVEKGRMPNGGTQLMYDLRQADRVANFTNAAINVGLPSLEIAHNADGTTNTVFKERDTVSLKDVVSALGNENAEDFNLAMLAYRARKVGADRIFGRDAEGKPKISNAELTRLINWADSTPNVQAARTLYNQYNKNLIELLQASGYISKDSVDKLLKGGDYIPAYRQDGSGDLDLVIGEEIVRIGNIKDQAELKALKGSDMKILPFPQSGLINTRSLLQHALRNRAAAEAATFLQDQGLGEMFRAEKNKALPTGKNVIQFRKDGVDHAFVIESTGDLANDVSPELLVKGLEGVTTNIPALLRLMNLPSRLLRYTVTRFPAYAVRQLIRDPWAAHMLTGADFKPVRDTIKNFQRAMSGRDATMKALQQKGLIGGVVYEGDNETVARLLKQLAQGGHGPMQRAMMALDELAVGSDATTRISLYDAFKKQGMTELEAQLATMESMNFNTHGASPSMRMLSMMVPFMSAQINGLDVLYKTASGKMPLAEKTKAQSKFIKRAGMLIAASMLYALAAKDEEWYKNATPQEKYGFFFVPTPFTEEPLKVPIPFELGLLFKAIPEALVNLATGDAGDAAQAFEGIRDQVIANIPGAVMPQALKPALEGAMNHSLFTGRPVESEGMRRLPIADRAGDFTTETAKALSVSFELAGKEWGLSPVMIEHLVRGYTGAMGPMIMQMADMIFASDTVANRPEMRASDLPVVGSLFQRTHSGGIIDLAYDAADRAEKQSQRFRQAMESGDYEKAQAVVESTKFARSALTGDAVRFRKDMAELNQLMRQIRNDRTMPPSQKREMITELEAARVERAKMFKEMSAMLH